MNIPQNYQLENKEKELILHYLNQKSEGCENAFASTEEKGNDSFNNKSNSL